MPQKCTSGEAARAADAAPRAPADPCRGRPPLRSSSLAPRTLHRPCCRTAPDTGHASTATPSPTNRTRATNSTPRGSPTPWSSANDTPSPHCSEPQLHQRWGCRLRLRSGACWQANTSAHCGDRTCAMDSHISNVSTVQWRCRSAPGSTDCGPLPAPANAGQNAFSGHVTFAVRITLLRPSRQRLEAPVQLHPEQVRELGLSQGVSALETGGRGQMPQLHERKASAQTRKDEPPLAAQRIQHTWSPCRRHRCPLRHSAGECAAVPPPETGRPRATASKSPSSSQATPPGPVHPHKG